MPCLGGKDKYFLGNLRIYFAIFGGFLKMFSVKLYGFLKMFVVFCNLNGEFFSMSGK